MTDNELLRRWSVRPVTRRGVIAAGAATAFLVACGETEVGPQPSSNGTTTKVPEKIEDKLSIYNWADYVNPKTYPMFEKEFKVEITEDNYPSNEDALAKLQAGARGYDIVVPTGYMVETMVQKDLLLEIDHSQIPNMKLIEDQFLDLPFDPKNRFSLPKDYGTTGFSYRSTFVTEEMASWEDFFKLAPKYTGRYTVLDSPPEVVGAALKMLGYSYNSTDAKEIAEATDVLVKFKPHVRRITSSMREIMISGEAYICLTWNGEIGYVALDAKDARYVVPAEGSEVWTDNWSIVTEAPHPAAAHAFINWQLQPKIQALDTTYHYYGAVVKGEKKFLPKALANDPAVYPPADVEEKLEVAQATPEWLALRNEAWTKFKAA